MRINRCSHAIPYKISGESHESMHDESRMSRYRTYAAKRNGVGVGGTAMSMEEIFGLASKEVPTVTVRKGCVGGKPCIEGTRVPVYMILDAIEYSGSLDGAVESYPQLSREQVKEAVRFSKLILECPVDNKIEVAS